MSKHVFQVSGNKIFIREKTELQDKFSPGIYNIDASADGIYFTKLSLISDEIIPVTNSPAEEIIKDINHFMKPETQDKYKEYGFVHKRGILMHGRGGTGKSTTIIEIANGIVSGGGIVFFNANPRLLAAVLPVVRENTPNAIIGVIYEEFDEWILRDAASMLSFLDGELQVNNVVFLGATNYISKIPERIKNRPSRFAKVVELKEPDANFRKHFFSRKLKGDDILRLEEFISITEGMVVDQLKDVIISVCCAGVSLPDAVNKIKSMQENGIGIDDAQESYSAGALRDFNKSLTHLRRDFGLVTQIQSDMDIPLITLHPQNDGNDKT